MLRALTKWFGSQSSTRASSKAQVRPARRTRLGLEVLEDRLVMSGGVTPGYLLDNTGNLYNTTGKQQQLIDTAVQNFAVVNNKVYDLHTDASLARLNPDGSSKAGVGNHVQSFQVAGNGSVYLLDSAGNL